jgi:hypothetical protein
MRRAKNKGMSGWGAGVGILSMLITVAIIVFLFRWVINSYLGVAGQAGTPAPQQIAPGASAAPSQPPAGATNGSPSAAASTKPAPRGLAPIQRAKESKGQVESHNADVDKAIQENQ